jgi:hypothetical protein
VLYWLLASVRAGGVSRRQCAPPSVVPSSPAHRPGPQATDPSAKPRPAETKVIDTTPNTVDLLAAVGGGELPGGGEPGGAGLLAGPGDSPAGVPAGPQAASAATTTAPADQDARESQVRLPSERIAEPPIP